MKVSSQMTEIGLIKVLAVLLILARYIDGQEDDVCENCETSGDSGPSLDELDMHKHHGGLQNDEHHLNIARMEYIANARFHQVALPIDQIRRFDPTKRDRIPAGEFVFEGDMVIEDDIRGAEEEEDELLLEDLGRKFLPLDKYLWPLDPATGLNIVPFTISSKAEKSRYVILEAMAMWEIVTCISFIELEYPTNTSHINFIRKAGCWSFVGRQYKTPGPQLLSVGRGCQKAGIIAHEIGHALGMVHEQSRSDRDDHVVVIWDNIKSRKRKNFKKGRSSNANVPYDSSSIMHYGGFFFSKKGDATLVTKNPYHQWHLGQRDHLSFRDVLIVNTMYGCVGRWSDACKNENFTQCENGGFLFENCRCQCPPGTEGDQCQRKTGEYYPELQCGGNVTDTRNISSPNFPYPFPSDSWCMWWAQARECQQVKLTFHYFDLMLRGEKRCFWDTLEIRDEDPVMPGKVFCGYEIEDGQSFYSKKGEMFVAFHGKHEYAIGFSATFDFIDDPDCGSSSTESVQENLLG